MIHTVAIENYRSILKLVIPTGRLTIITGANGTGKSCLYRALRLLAETVQGSVIQSIAAEGGLDSVFWAGPHELTRRMKTGDVPVQGGPRNDTVRLRLGFASDEFGYSIDLGLPPPSSSVFTLDPEIKREVIWAGHSYRRASSLVERSGHVVKIRDGKGFRVVSQHINLFDSLYTQLADPVNAPEVFTLRETIRDWRFYDHFRTDVEAPARLPQLGTRTPVLSHDGHDVAAAIQTIREIGDIDALEAAVDDAFPGASLDVEIGNDGRFRLQFSQPGLLRTLTGAELSDGTLRYLLWVAALLTPRPPALMVLNEPETSLHPDLLPALARLITGASSHSQVWIVSHARRLIGALEELTETDSIELEKELGQTLILGQRMLDEPSWHWPSKS